MIISMLALAGSVSGCVSGRVSGSVVGSDTALMGASTASLSGDRTVASQGSEAATATVDGLYVNTFGDRQNPPIIFVHGGPGFNSADFEATTAEPLSKLGFFVVVYDQRGQGRSAGLIQNGIPSGLGNQDAVVYTYRQYGDDLMRIIASLRLKDVTLVAHSHGGPIAIKFDETYPNLTKAIVLVSAPINFWSTMASLYEHCKARYESGTSEQKSLLPSLVSSFEQVKATMKGRSELINPVASLFQHALYGCRLYGTAQPTEDELRLSQLARLSPAPMEQLSMPGFLVNESYVFRNHFELVEKRKGHYFGIYGDEDGLFDSASLDLIRAAVGSERFFMIHAASHAVYIGQQARFLETLRQIVSPAVGKR